MNFTMNLGDWNSVFAVPCSLVDKHIKLAGALQLKVLLWVLRHAGEPFSSEEISKALGATPADTSDALQYWTEVGLLAKTGDTLLPANKAESATPESVFVPDVKTPESQPLPAVSAKPHRLPRPDGVFIAKRINESQEIHFLMQEAQTILGRPLSPGLASSLMMIHDDYGLPVDVMLMLLQYVKSRGKDNTSYIESVARNWSSEGIDTHEKADEKLKNLDEIARAWRVIEQALGIHHRSPSAKEEQWAARWIMEWKFSPDMIREAYERCVNATGKLNFSYMNKILERWQRNHIATVQQAADEQKEPKTENPKGRKPTYDLEEFERLNKLHMI